MIKAWRAWRTVQRNSRGDGVSLRRKLFEWRREFAPYGSVKLGRDGLAKWERDLGLPPLTPEERADRER